ncbi:MAG: response regulator [Lachnospiraceae bacterium]|nr:response regulator [Lachnospiraceae bacterium]
MNTIYIVDDENIVLDGLVNWVDWAQIDVKVLGTASSGVTALNEILYYKPDVVLTDIRMPGKNGLELIEEVKKTLPEVSFIVLSGYSEFDYAQRAMHYGVKEYLLKPIEEEKVLEVVKKVLLERKAVGSGAMFPDNLETPEEWGLFRVMLNPNQPEENIPAMTVAVCDITGHVEELKDLGEILGALGLGKKGIFYARNYMEFILLFTGEAKNEVSELLLQIETILKQAFHVPVHFGICNREETECSSYRAYLHARQSGLSARFYCVSHLSQPQISQEWYEDPFHKKELFEMLCMEKEEQYAYEHFDRVYYSACSLGIRPQLLKRELAALIQYLNSAFREKYDKPVLSARQLQSTLNAVDDAEDFLQLRENIDTIFQMMQRFYQDCCQDYQVKTINRIKEFVNDNVDQALDTAMIADCVHMSQNYIGCYFKKYTGKVLSDYVLHVKMEKAIWFLENSSMKINHIASAVGFSDPKYFCKVFKKYAGITASDYRKKR